MKKYRRMIAAALCVLLFSACAAQENRNTGVREKSDTEANKSSNTAAPEDGHTGMSENNHTQEETEMKMHVRIGDYTFTATLEQNQAVKELVEMMQESPVTVAMRDYSGFEKVGSLGKALAADDRQTTTTEGDIVLYNGNQIVIFYGSNAWSYTRIGKIDDLTNWKKALGSGDVTAVFTVAE